MHYTFSLSLSTKTSKNSTKGQGVKVQGQVLRLANISDREAYMRTQANRQLHVMSGRLVKQFSRSLFYHSCLLTPSFVVADDDDDVVFVAEAGYHQLTSSLCYTRKTTRLSMPRWITSQRTRQANSESCTIKSRQTWINWQQLLWRRYLSVECQLLLRVGTTGKCDISDGFLLNMPSFTENSVSLKNLQKFHGPYPPLFRDVVTECVN